MRDGAMALILLIRKWGVDTRELAEVRIEAEIKMGGLLKTGEMAKGAQGTGSNQYKVVQYQDGTAPPTLEQRGISRNESSRWQRLFKIDWSIVQGYFAWARTEDTTPTLAQVAGKSVDRHDRLLASLPPSPWPR